MKKKINLKTDLLQKYSQFVLKNGKKPLNVFSFCEEIATTESEFYKQFANFETLEQEYLKHFFNATVELILADETYQQAGAKEKLLSFYFTFFEQLTQNRSLMMYLLQHAKSLPHVLKTIHPLKSIFIDYVKTLDIQVMETNLGKLESYKEQSVNELAWLHLVATLQFWVKDTSPSFEKTDIFIEKSIDTSFEFTHLEPLKKMIDFGKFLWKEKMN